MGWAEDAIMGGPISLIAWALEFGASSGLSGLPRQWSPLSLLVVEALWRWRLPEREKLDWARRSIARGLLGFGREMMAGVPADTQGSTALKALATDKISTGILQSANLLHLLRNSSHSEIVAKLPKDLSLKVPNIKTTGDLLEQMPSVIVALDSHLDNAIRSSSMLKEVRSILVDSPHSPPTPLPTNHFQDPSTER